MLSLLLFNMGLTYDPAAWAVWAAELPHRKMGLGSGPSWKPLPVFVTAPFALVSWNFGGTVWLAITRACALGTSVILWRMASRVASADSSASSSSPAAVAAGATAALIPWLIPSWVQFAAGGGSEPVLMALLLAGVEAHLARHYRLALALGVLAGLVRPEVWAFLALYGIWMLRRDWRRAALPLGLGALIELVGWFGIPSLAGGDPLQATHRARVYTNRIVPVDEFASRVAAELPWPAWALIAIGVGVTIRLRDRLLTTFTAAGLGWLVLVTVMTELGYSGIARYALPALILLAVPAGAAVGWAVGLAGSWQKVGLGFTALALVLMFATREPLLKQRVDKVEQIGTLGKSAVAAMNEVGGPHKLIARCGSLGTGWIYTPVISWRAQISLGNVGRLHTAPTILLLPTKPTTSTAFPGLRDKFQPVPPAGATTSKVLASNRDWQVVEYSSATASCRR